MEKRFILGIDQGSTGSKVLVVDWKGEVICSAYRPIESFYPQDGWLEHDASAVWESVRDALLEAAEKFDFSLLRAIGITNQRESTVLWDRATGEALTPLISWQCTRSREIVERWAAFGEEISCVTGLLNNTYFSASKVAWLLERDDALRKRCEEGTVCFGNVNSWLLWKLTNGVSHLTDSTNAGRTMFFDVRKNQWDTALLEKMQIPPQILPHVLPCNADFGMAVSPIAAFSSPVPVMASIGDQMSALFGQACFRRGEAKCTIGTSLNLVTYTGEYVPPAEGILPAIACNLSGEMSYEMEGGVYVAGSTNEWLTGQLGIAESPRAVDTLAQQVESADGVYLVPAFQGLGAPHWNSGARGLIIGLSRYHDKRHICRAAVEAIALQTNDVLETLRTRCGLDISTLKVDGGVAKSDFAMQIMADICDCRVERPKNTDRTPMGAIYLAGIASGLWHGREELREMWKLDRAFVPQMEGDARERLLSGWREAVRRSLDWTK